jgi:hypothetical protein
VDVERSIQAQGSEEIACGARDALKGKDARAQGARKRVRCACMQLLGIGYQWAQTMQRCACWSERRDAVGSKETDPKTLLT